MLEAALPQVSLRCCSARSHAAVEEFMSFAGVCEHVMCSCCPCLGMSPQLTCEQQYAGFCVEPGLL